MLLVLCFGFLATKYVGSYLPDQGLILYPSAFEGEILATGPPGKSLDFWVLILPGLAICRVPACDDGQWQQPQLPVATDQKGKQLIQCNHSVSIQPICFSLSVQYSTNYMRQSTLYYRTGFVHNPLWQSSQESTCNAGDKSSIPGSERFPGEGNGNSLQYSCLGNPMDRAEEPGRLQSMG